MLIEEEFPQRLAELRTKKGVSARDMSLSIGQGPGYINNIENGHNLPSMSVFFYICDYLGITPSEFFDLDVVTFMMEPSWIYYIILLFKMLYNTIK